MKVIRNSLNERITEIVVVDDTAGRRRVVADFGAYNDNLKRSVIEEIISLFKEVETMAPGDLRQQKIDAISVLVYEFGLTAEDVKEYYEGERRKKLLGFMFPWKENIRVKINYGSSGNATTHTIDVLNGAGDIIATGSGTNEIEKTAKRIIGYLITRLIHQTHGLSNTEIIEIINGARKLLEEFPISKEEAVQSAIEFTYRNKRALRNKTSKELINEIFRGCE